MNNPYMIAAVWMGLAFLAAVIAAAPAWPSRWWRSSWASWPATCST